MSQTRKRRITTTPISSTRHCRLFLVADCFWTFMVMKYKGAWLPHLRFKTWQRLFWPNRFFHQKSWWCHLWERQRLLQKTNPRQKEPWSFYESGRLTSGSFSARTRSNGSPDWDLLFRRLHSEKVWIERWGCYWCHSDGISSGTAKK